MDEKCCVEFYVDKNSRCLYQEHLDKLSHNGRKSDVLCIQKQVLLLQEKGLAFMQTARYIKHLRENIWELKPGRNRVLFKKISEYKVVILHCFIKKDKTQQNLEILKAIEESRRI